MRRDYGYPIPDDIDPPGDKCIKVYVPDAPGYTQSLAHALSHFAKWVAWARDEQRSGAVVAARWRQALEKTWASWDEGCQGEPPDAPDPPDAPPDEPETIVIERSYYRWLIGVAEQMSWFEIAQDSDGIVYLRQSNGWHPLQALPGDAIIIGGDLPDDRPKEGGEIKGDLPDYGGDTVTERAGLTFAAALHQTLAVAGDDYLAAPTIPAGIETLAKTLGLIFGAQVPYSLVKFWSDLIEAAAPPSGAAWADGIPVSLLSRMATEVACEGQPTDNALAVKMTPALQKALIDVAKSGSGPYYQATLRLFEEGLLDRWKSSVNWLLAKPDTVGTIPSVPLAACGEQFGSGQVLQPDYVTGQERNVIFTATQSSVAGARPLYVATWLAEFDGRHVGWVADFSLLPRQVTSGYRAGDAQIAAETGLLPLLTILAETNVVASVGDIYASSLPAGSFPGPASPAAIPQWFPEVTIQHADVNPTYQEIVEAGQQYGIGTGMFTDAEAVPQFTLKLRAIYYTGA